MSYKVSRFGAILGEDFQVPRMVGRRLLGLLIGLVPLKKWRRAIRDRVENWMIRINKNKIDYFIEHYPPMHNEIETVERMIEGASLARLNDGEYNLMLGIHKRSYQKLNDQLVVRLREVLNSDSPNLLVGIAGVRSVDDLGQIWKKFIIRKGNRTLKLFDRNKVYYSSSVAGLLNASGEMLEHNMTLFKRVWEGRKVLFVVGKNSRFFFSEELFDNIDTHDFVYAPPKNAFSSYDEILNDIRQYDKDWLVLISLGPTAAVMAYDLSREGYQAIDFGQVPSVYHRAKYGTRYPQGHRMREEHDRRKKAVFK